MGSWIGNFFVRETHGRGPGTSWMAVGGLMNGGDQEGRAREHRGLACLAVAKPF